MYLANSNFHNYEPYPRVLRRHRVLKILKKNKDILITMPHKGNCTFNFRGGSRAAATSKMVSFVIIVNSFQLLNIITKSSILEVAVILDPCLIFDRKLYNNAFQQIILDTSKLEELNVDPILKRKASLQRFSRKLKQRPFFNEIEYDQLYLSDTPPAHIYDTSKMRNFSASDLHAKLPPIVSFKQVLLFIIWLIFFAIFFHL